MDRKRAAFDTRIAAGSAAAGPNKDPFTYEKEKERFLKDLRQFHEGRGTTVPRWPYVGGKPVDLHALYTAVTQLGGWEKVSNDEAWSDIQEQFGIPTSCCNADYALRQIYIRYLNAYERLHHFGQDPDSREDATDLDDLPSSRKKTSGPVGGVAVTYNYQQHNLTDSTREMLGLPKESSRLSEYSRIERSLMSGLPNELDFAVNICLLLSTEGKLTLKGDKALRIVELLLSHVGISKEVELALIWLIPDNQLNFLKFWNESVDDHEVKELLCPECLLVDKVEEYRTENETGSCDADSSKVLHIGRGLGTEDCEALRVVQLATILRNLSFEEENLECFASSLIVFRFVMLCIYSKNGCIRQLALDTMANIAFKIDVLFLRKMCVEPVDCGLSQLVLRTVSAFLTSSDKFEVVSALEMLSRLCQVESNEDAISTQLNDTIYEHLIQLLTIQDLQLIVSALETIYQLSEIGAATSNRIANVRASIDVLVALLTVEAQSYGPCSLPGVTGAENTMEVENPAQSQTMGPPPARLAPPVGIKPPLPQPCVVSHVSAPPVSQSPLPPRPPIPPVPSSVALQSQGPTVRPASVLVVADGEAAACSWLLAQYELSADSSLKKMEMYRKYASVFGVYGLQNLVSPTCFANCIRVTFPSVEQEFIDKDGSNEVVYKGLTSRQKPRPFSPTTGDLPHGHQMIPGVSTGAALGLLKTGQTATHLTAQSGASSSMVVTFPAIQQVLQNHQGRQESPPTGHSDGLASAAAKPTAATPPEMNFVKSLLASKVAQNMNRTLVQDANSQQAASDGDSRFSQEHVTNDRLLPDFTRILPTYHQNSHCVANEVSATDGANQGVLEEHAYIQTTEAFPNKLEFCSSDSVNGGLVAVVANQTDVSTGQFDTAGVKSINNLTNCDGTQSRDLDVTFTRLPSEVDCLGSNSCRPNAADGLISFDGLQVANVPAVVNGTFAAVRISGKSHNILYEDCSVAEKLNGKELLPALNGVVRDLVNGDCFSENSNPESGPPPTEKMETWSVTGQDESKTMRQTSGSNYAPARDTVSPFPPSANVDGLSDDVSKETLQGEDKTSGSDLNRLCRDPRQAGATVAADKDQSQLSQFEAVCDFPEAAADNSEILLLEDFTVAREEVLISDIPEQAISVLSETSNTSGVFNPRVIESKSSHLVSSQEISQASSFVVQNSQDYMSQSIDSVKYSLPSMSLPMPIVIPANIQAKLASFQDGSSSSMTGHQQMPCSSVRGAISQSFLPAQPLSSAIFQRPLINQNSMASFSQIVPTNDARQQHTTLPEIVSNLQGNCETSSDLPSTGPLEATLQGDDGLAVQQTLTENQLTIANAIQLTSAAMQMSNVDTLVSQNTQQVVMANPWNVQSTEVPALQLQNSSSAFVASSPGPSTSQGARLQFLTSSMGPGLSNSVRIPQLHRFVATTTPGRIIIQRAQIVPQGQQSPLQGHQPQSLRPIQQPFFQRFVVSQAGGSPQRQILIQSSPVLMHQGAHGTGQARPVFVPQAGQVSSTGQSVVMSPSGQILSQPQQRQQVGQAGQLTAYRLAPLASHSGQLVQPQVVGQPGQQGLVSRPLVVQQTQPSVQQGQMVMQPGQQMVQQDMKAVGQSGDLQNQGHGQVIVPNPQLNIQQNQIGQMITHQGQAGSVFTPQGQLLVGQQGQILCHPGQQSQGQNTGPVVIQHNGGQFILHSGSNSLPGCLMSLPVSSFQHGVGLKRLAETSNDQGLSLCMSSSTVACRTVTANAPLNSGISVTTSVQQSQISDQSSPSSTSSAKKRKPTASTSQSRLTKKRKKEGDEQTVGDGETSQGKTPVQYLCEWNGCQRCFGSFNSIFLHVTKDHFETIKESSITCKWTGCDTLMRQRWSFMTHLQDRHLNENSLRAAASRRQQQSPGSASPSPQTSTVPPTAAVYPPNAALQAIRRFSARPPFPELSDAKEGPLSKHIHLTSALILRNLARYSPRGRSLIKKHEKHLALIAFSETESSSAISNCLWELQRH